MVMIDQDQLQELLNAKETLDKQKQQSVKQTKVNIDSIMSTAFGNALFSTPQNQNCSDNRTPSTQESSQESQDQIQQVMKFNDMACQEPSSKALFKSNFSSPLMKNQLKPKQANTGKLDSKFNKNFIEDEFDDSLLGTSAQGRAIGNNLLNIIDDESDQSVQHQTPQGLVSDFGNMNLNQYPLSNEHSNQSSNLSSENSGRLSSNGQPEFSSIFTHQGLYMPQAQQKPAFNPAYMSKDTVNAPVFKPTGAYFKPLSQVNDFVPKQVAQEEGTSTNENLFAFPEGGWECSKCQNYNFKGRDQCYRCKKDKTCEDREGKPKHMSQAKMTRRQKRINKKEKDGQAQKEISSDNSINDENLVKYANKWASQPDYRNPKEKTMSQEVRGNNGSWACQNCNNHNFGFRGTCNLCGMVSPYAQMQQMQQQQWCQQQTPNYGAMGTGQQAQNMLQQQVFNFNQQQFPAL